MRHCKIAICLAAILSAASCTNLDETIYGEVSGNNYYNTKMDVIRAAFRPFEHAYYSVQSRQVIEELSGDLVATWKKDDWWEDGGRWSRLHYHTWTVEDEVLKTEWDGCFTGIMQCNYILDDLNSLDPARFGMTAEEFGNLTAQCRTLRAWFYIRLLGMYRNIPLAVSRDASLNSEGQVPPENIFSFIETELKDCLELLQTKQGAAGNGNLQGQWTKAGAAALLMRLYLNAEKWTGAAMYEVCRIRPSFENICHHVVFAVAFDLDSACRGVCASYSGEDKLKIIKYFRCSGHCRARVLRIDFLLYSDGGRKSLDNVHVRLAHPAEKLPRI